VVARFVSLSPAVAVGAFGSPVKVGLAKSAFAVMDAIMAVRPVAIWLTKLPVGVPPTATMALRIQTALEALSSVGVRNVATKFSYTDVDDDIYVVDFLNDITENLIEDRMTLDST